MNLEQQAENETPRRTRSKLEDQREAIFTLRRKHWTYRQIAQWLNERGMAVTHTAVYRFCERSTARRPCKQIAPAAGGPPATVPAPMQLDPDFFNQTPPTTTINERTTKTSRFNLNI